MDDLNERRPSRIALIISILVLLGSFTYALKLNSPTGKVFDLAFCVDSDEDTRVAPFTEGYARDVTHTVLDLCIDEKTIYEAYCDEQGKARQVAIRCPIGKSCVVRACEQ